MISLWTAAVAGLVLVLAYPPYGWAFVTVPALMLFLYAVRRTRRPAEAALVGGVFGLVFFGFLFPWLGELGWIALVPLMVVEAAFPAAYAWLLRRFAVPAWTWLALAVGGWAAMEWLRVRFPVGGFGWGLLGYPMGEYAATRGATQWIGTSGWSVILVGFAGGLLLSIDELVSRRRLRRVLGWALTPALVVAGLAIGGAAVPTALDGDPVRVAIVQGSTPCPLTRCVGERSLIYQRHLDLTRRLTPGTVDLVVWAEGSTGYAVDPVLNPEVGAEIGAEAARLGAVFLVGGDRPLTDTEWVNVNVVFDQTGARVGEYRKQHPVPFGEYVPARSLFGWIEELERVPRDMIRGDGPVVWDLGFGPFGSTISFESSFARYSRQEVESGARLLVVATSQQSYPFSRASDQLIGITRMRSAELGVDVVHSAVTGRSALITDGGVVAARTELVEPAVLEGVVHVRRTGLTLYALVGDWVQWAAMASAASVAFGSLWKRRREGWVLEPGA